MKVRCSTKPICAARFKNTDPGAKPATPAPANQNKPAQPSGAGRQYGQRRLTKAAMSTRRDRETEVISSRAPWICRAVWRCSAVARPRRREPLRSAHAVNSAALFAKLRRPFVGGKSLNRTRLIWLGGAVALIVIGLALAYLNPPPTAQSVSTAINVELPPASGANTGAGTSTGAGTGGSSATLLTPAPEPGMIEDTPNGPLPIVGKDGHQAWQVYARPFDSKDVRPRIALIVTGVGLDQTLSQAALDRLPGTITFAFDPYASNVKDNVTNARNLGHEALLGLPLEPLDYPRQDPGPLTLLTALDVNQNADRLAKLMGKATGYVGFVAIMGARFESENAGLCRCSRR